MADVSIGTARGVVRIDYESRGAARVSSEFEKIKNQTESTATSFATWANKIGMGSAELAKVNQIQRAVAEAQKTANYFALQRDNILRAGNASFSDQLRLMKLASESQKSLASMTKVAAEANKRLPMEMAKAGQVSAKAFTDEFERGAVARLSASSGKGGGNLGAALGGILSVGMKATVAAGLAAATAGAAGLFGVLSGGAGRLTGIDTATYKLKALGLEGNKVKGVMEDALKAVQGTQYSLDQAVNVAAGAVQSGIKPGNDLVQYLKNVQGLAAVTQMDLQSVGMIMNRVQVNGRVMSEDLQQLEYVGVNIMPMLQKEYGKTAAEMSKMRQNGEIDAAHFNSAIKNNFGEAADIMGNSLSGSVANMKTAFKRLGANILAPIFTPLGNDKPALIVNVIKGIQNAVDGLGKWFQQHQKGLIDFWEIFGKAVIIAGAIIVDAAGVIVGALATIAKGVSWLTRAVAWGFDIFGGDGIAEKVRGAADTLSEFGNDAYGAAGKLFGLNSKLADGWNSLGDYSDAAKAAVDNTESFAGAAEDAVPKLISIEDAIGKLGKTSDDVTKAIQGTDEEWEKFIKSLRDKGAPQAVVDVLENLRNNFENGGRAALNYSKALKQMGDSSVDASSKAQALIKSLQDLKMLPGEGADALEEYNQAVADATDYNNNLVDILGTTGNALVTQSGQIDTNSKNGRALVDVVKNLRDKMFELAASGEATPAEAWKRTHDVLMNVAAQFGITGDAAEKFIQTYLLPQHTFELQLSVKGKENVQNDLAQLSTELDAAKKRGDNKFQVGITGDPKVVEQVVKELGLEWDQYDPFSKTAVISVPPGTDIAKTKAKIEQLINADPTELKSELKVITSKQDIINQINGGDPLKIPAVLDFTGQQPIGPTQGPPLPPANTPTPPTNDNPPPPVTVPNPILPQPVPPGTAAPITPGGLLGDEESNPYGGGPDSSDKEFPEQDTGGKVHNLLRRRKEEIAAKLLEPNPILEQGAHQQGLNFGISFAQGIRDSIPQVLQAALELATASTDPLGHSPAKIGPLAGSGWTYFRGRTYSEAYAEGIAAGQQAVGGAALSIAGASSDPLTDSFSKLMRDAGEWVQFGRHIFDLVSSLTDISFNVLNVGQQLSGGKLFPKSYQRDPNAKKRGPGMVPWYPTPAAKDAEPQSYTPNASPSAAVTPQGTPSLREGAYKQEIADYIINKAMSLGYSREQANKFLVQAVGESGLNPLANGENQDGTGDVRGIFQFTPGTWGDRPGFMTNAQDNIDAYFDLAAERGLTPENFTAGSQLGTQVSIGGPWHPDNANKGHLSRAQAEAQPYINNYGVPSKPVVPQQNPNVPVREGLPKWKVGVGFVDENGNLVMGPNLNPKNPWAPMDSSGNPIAPVKPSGTGGMQNFGPKNQGAARPYMLGGNADYTRGFAQSKGIAPLYNPGEYEYGGNGLPQWVYDFAARFGLQAASSVGISGKNSLHGAGLAFDFSGPQENMTQMAKFIQENLAAQTLQLIYQDAKGNKYGIAGGQQVGPGTGSPQYYSQAWDAHANHVHWATDMPVGGGYPPLTPATNASDIKPVPVTLGPNSIDPQANSAATPLDPDNPLGLPAALADMAANDSKLYEAITASKGVAGGILPDDQVSQLLQHLDGLIADQNNMNSPQSKATASALGQIRDNLMVSYGMKEGQNPLEIAQSITQNVAGIVGDVFNTIDSSLKSIESTKEIGDTLVRGIANTQDINRIVDNVQSFIELGKNIAQTTSDVLGFAGMLTGMAGAGDTSGGSQAAAAALGAASSIAGIISQGWAAVNSTIDLVQEGYRMGTKYLGRALQNWYGLPGATDIQYLLDTMNGQLQVYTSENPMMKSTFNTFARELGNPGPGRTAPTNNLYVYQGPGQDPRDTMNDAMFAVRSSGMGVFGYAS